MKSTCALTLFVILAFGGYGRADEAALGSVEFQPSMDHPVGWRGDGNGRYPAADPLLTWGRVSVAVKGLNTQANKPKPDDKGKPLAQGVIREWLVLGPVPIPEGKAVKDDFGTDEDKLAPDAGNKLSDLEWKAVTLDTSWLHFWPMYGKGATDIKKAVAYAHTWIYSAEGKPVGMNVMLSYTSKVWLNGKDLGVFGPYTPPPLRLPLEKGWNRLLLRVAPQTDTGWSRGVVQWHFNAGFFGTERDEYESRNILWSTPMPDHGPGVGSPILVGDKLLVQAEAGCLLCLSARDGKVLWARSSTYADAATPQEREKFPEVFAEVDQLAGKINDSLKAYREAPDKYCADPRSSMVVGTVRGELVAWEKKIDDLLKKVDAEKYFGRGGSEGGEAAATPASDGLSVYALYGSGVVACFDLDGNRKWTSVVDVRNPEHGYCASPCLVDGKVVIKASGYLGAVALDARTGAVVTPMPLWKAKGLAMFSTPLAMAVGGEKLVVQSFGLITRVRDGKVVAKDFTPAYYNTGDYISPTFEGGTLCSHVLAKAYGGTRFAFQRLPDAITDPLVMKDTKQCEYDCKAFPCWFSYDHCASPLLYQGLAYVLSVDGVLTVIDAAKGEVVYQKMLDFSPVMAHNGPIVRAGCSASPTLAGKYIYLWDDQGTTVVIEPGRTFKQVARNRIEQLSYRFNECTISNPVFSGNRIYYRGEVNLYCIGEK